MASLRVWFLRHALITATLAAAMLAIGGAPASAAQPVEPAAKSLQAAVDDFIVYLKSETHHAATAAARYARENRHHLEAFENRLAEHWGAWTAALSDRKESLGTLAGELSALWEDWSGAAVSAWVELERHAIDALDWILDFARPQSRSDQRAEIPV